MRRIVNGVVFAGAAGALVALSGCASIEDVERAQAGRAQQTAMNAQAAADRAVQTANAAQSSADRVAASVNESRTQVSQLNQQVESMRPRRGMRD